MTRARKISFMAKYFASVFIKWTLVAIVIMTIIVIPVLLFTALLK